MRHLARAAFAAWRALLGQGTLPPPHVQCYVRPRHTMGQWLIASVALIGFIAPLLPGWRTMLLASVPFALGNWALLSQVHAALAAEPNPGPGARGIALLVYAPTAAFLLACLFRALFEAGRHTLRRLRSRSVRGSKSDTSGKST